MDRIKATLKQRWIPGIFVLGFLVVVAVNTVLIVTATGTFSGLVVAHPYKKSAEFNRLQQDLTEQKTLHWQYSLGSETLPDGGLRLVLDWRDAEGRALSGLALQAELSRPVENLSPLALQFHALGGGRYEARLAQTRPGQWDLRAHASRDGHSFSIAERFTVQAR